MKPEFDPIDLKTENVITKEMTQELKDLHFKMKKLGIESMKAKLQTNLTNCMEDFQTYRIEEHKAEIARLEFWLAVRKQYNLWIEEQIGIKEGYAVVTKKNDSEDCDCGEDHGKIIKKILGGDKKSNVINLSDFIKKMLEDREGGQK